MDEICGGCGSPMTKKGYKTNKDAELMMLWECPKCGKNKMVELPNLD